MDADKIRELLEQVRGGAVDVDGALERLKHMPFEDLGFAKVDHHRALRQGMPEVIFGLGKAPEHVREIAVKLAERTQNLLITRTSPDAAKLAVVCAGTSDIPVAEEARITAEVMGNEVESIHDIGVAGIHRLMSNRERLTQAKVIVVCAGMEGALPSAVGGLVSVPVIAVPTSIGYGASFNGLAALLGMLNSCASNVTVVNIDNGFGGGYVASLINRP